MSDTTNGVNEILSELYDIIQEAKGAMLHPEKCVINRDDALNLIEEVIAALPAEIKSAKTIVDARNELIAQGRKEAETAVATARAQSDEMLAKARKDADMTLAKAQEKANEMISQEAVYIEAQKQSKEMIEQAQRKIDELKAASHSYMDNSLAETEKSIERALNDIKTTRAKFNSMTGQNKKQETAEKPKATKAQSFFHDISID